MRLTIQDIEEALAASGPEAPYPASPPFPPQTGGKVAKPDRGPIFTGVSTDTRTLRPGDLFVALVSLQADGHDFVPQALAAGAAGLVVGRPVLASDAVPVFQVPDTQVAYGQLARAWRDRFDIPVVGVTGSVGKTTLKEMLAAALSPLGPVLKTAASQNNETGVPRALLQLNESHKAAVVEMGMRGAGQIAYLCGIARPIVGVITVIGENHIELLGSQDAIADAKGELLDALPADGVAILNGDDPYCDRLRAKVRGRVVTFGIEMEALTPRPPLPRTGEGEAEGGEALAVSHQAVDPSVSGPPLPFLGEGPGVRVAGGPGVAFRASEVTRTDAGWHFAVAGACIEIASPSRHDVANAVAALAVADVLGVPLADAARALGAYAPPPMRMQVVATPWGGTVLNDAYNAAPASVRSALETLSAAPGRKIAFLGDMRELGDFGPAAHRQLGDTIQALGGLDALYTVGPLAAQIPGAALSFADSEGAARYARGGLDVRPGDNVLIKGSRAMAMERIADALQERGAHER